MVVNFLKETLETIKENGHREDDVLWVGDGKGCVNWDEFKAKADFEYNDEDDHRKIYLCLIIVGKDWWLERNNDDKCEWWEYKTLPAKPKLPTVHAWFMKLKE